MIGPYARIGSLFSGIGGFELGLEYAGVGRTVWQVEQDRHCLHWLAQHWPEVPRYTDVREVGAHNLEPVDILCGGFPCQDISHAGKGRGITAGTRSGLWFEFHRIIEELAPTWVIIENVAALDSRRHREGLHAVLGGLRSLGYRGERSRIPAARLGAPHGRDRLFILARRMADTDGGRREQRDASERRDAVAGARLAPMGDASSGGRGTGAGLPVRRPAGGRAGVGEPGGEPAAGGEHRRPAEGSAATRPAGALVVRHGDRDLVDTDDSGPARQRLHGRAGLPEPGQRGEGGGAVGDTAGARREGRRPHAGRASRRDTAQRQHGTAGAGVAPWHPLTNWRDVVAVRGFDDTVRLIPRAAWDGGPESPLWPVAHGVPARVARLRAVGNAVVPAVAFLVGRQLLALEAEYQTRGTLGDADGA